MFGYENLAAVFGEDSGGGGGCFLLWEGSGEQNIIMKAHYGDWGLRFFEVSQLSEKASDVHQLQ